MNIAKAINRLNWRMTNSKFTPNENDKQAIDFLTEWVNNQKAKNFKSHKLFIKMFMYGFYYELAYWKDLETAQRLLLEQLEKPVEYHYERFYDLLKTLELEAFKRKIGYCNKMIEFMSDEEEQKNNDLVKMYKNEFINHQTGKVIEIEEVFAGLNNLLTEAINKFSKLP